MWGKKPLIDFSCNQEDYGAVAEPVPASKVLPDWYKKLPRIDPAEQTTQVTGKTVKTCMPFFDAMSLGWVLPAPVELTVEVTADGKQDQQRLALRQSAGPRHAPVVPDQGPPA